MPGRPRWRASADIAPGGDGRGPGMLTRLSPLATSLRPGHNRRANMSYPPGEHLLISGHRVWRAEVVPSTLLTMVEHRQEFQNELDDIEAKVIELFAMVAEDLPLATHALLSGDNDAVGVLAERDRTIDALY